jgi:hypothetical protein
LPTEPFIEMLPSQYVTPVVAGVGCRRPHFLIGYIGL